jgi:uncharacterized protein
LGYNDGFTPVFSGVLTTMLLDLSKLHGRREHLERTFQPSLFEPQDEDYRVATPVELSLDVEKAGSGVFLVSGRAVTRLQLECGRCLDEVEVPVDTRFELRYMPEESAADAAPDHEIHDDDLVASFYREGTLDVMELLHEQFQLALPMKPLCAQSCRGLCPECGANLNRTECGCQPTWEDPRLAPLKGLLNREKEN